MPTKEQKAAYNKAYYEKNKEQLKKKFREYQKKWSAEHKEQKKANHKRWYIENHQHARTSQKKWNEANGHKIKSNRLKPHNKYSCLFISSNRRAKNNRNCPVELTLEHYWFIVSKGCFYCGIDLTLENGSSIDRIDNQLGYVKHNCIPCCWKCNTTRGDRWAVYETKLMITAVLDYRKSHAKSVVV